jgi:hypothetical protein
MIAVALSNVVGSAEQPRASSATQAAIQVYANPN